MNDQVDGEMDEIAITTGVDSGEEMGNQEGDRSFTEDNRPFAELVESVDFPRFVADLIKGVFDANIAVMKKQTDAYIKLMKEVEKSTVDFIKQVKDEESFMKLAESKGDKYGITIEQQMDGCQKLVLTTLEGDQVDMEDAAVKCDILAAKIHMAKEHRAALREVLLMGINRLVVTRGEIKAVVEYNVKANR